MYQKRIARVLDAMDKMGLVSGRFDDQGNIVKDNNSTDNSGTTVPAENADLVKADIDRVRSYKLVFDELANYKYGKRNAEGLVLLA